MSLLDRWALLKHQGTPDPWFDGEYLYLFKEGLGFNPNFTHTGSGVESADHTYFTATGSVTLAAFSIPATLNIARVYTDAAMGSVASNHLFSVMNHKTDGAASNVITRYSADQWNSGTTDRKTHWNSANVLHDQVWNLTIKSAYARAQVYNFYVTLK